MATRTLTCTQALVPDLRLKLTQPQKELWKEMTEKCLSPDEILHLLKVEQKRILCDASHRGSNCVTTNEADSLNWATKKGMEMITETFKKNALEILLLAPNDLPEVLKAKVELGKELMSWLQELVKWLAKQMGALDLSCAEKDTPNPDQRTQQTSYYLAHF